MRAIATFSALATCALSSAFTALPGPLRSLPCPSSSPFPLRCSREDAASLRRQAAEAQEAADAAALRAAALKNTAKSGKPRARNAAEALRNLPAPPPGQPSSPFMGSASDYTARTKFTCQMVEAEISKPMGLVLEENHPSVKVDRGAILVSGHLHTLLPETRHSMLFVQNLLLAIL